MKKFANQNKGSIFVNEEAITQPFKTNIMKNIKLKSEIENNLIVYYSNLITSSRFVDNHIRQFVFIDQEKEDKICEVIEMSQRGWDDIEINAEGATAEQDEALDQYLEKITLEILQIC